MLQKLKESDQDKAMNYFCEKIKRVDWMIA